METTFIRICLIVSFFKMGTGLSYHATCNGVNKPCLGTVETVTLKGGKKAQRVRAYWVYKMNYYRHICTPCYETYHKTDKEQWTYEPDWMYKDVVSL